MDLGSAGRGPKTKKPSVPKAWRDLRKSSKKALKLFSSFLRGASCPKSPRFKRKGENGPPSQLHLLSDRSLSMSSETSRARRRTYFWPRDCLCHCYNKTSRSCVQYASAMRHLNFRSTISREAHGNHRNFPQHPVFR